MSRSAFVDPGKGGNMVFRAEEIKGGRPPVSERKFVSPAIEQVITETKEKLKRKFESTGHDSLLATNVRELFPQYPRHNRHDIYH
jgi:hypothetical protein